MGAKISPHFNHVARMAVMKAAVFMMCVGWLATSLLGGSGSNIPYPRPNPVDGIPVDSLGLSAHTVIVKDERKVPVLIFFEGKQLVRGHGSASVIAKSPDGKRLLLVTNSHVLDTKNLSRNSEINVRFASGKESPALKIMDHESSEFCTPTDLALIEVDAAGLVEGVDFIVVAYDPSVKPKVGDEVVAVGTPMDEDLAGTHTFGRISAVRKGQTGTQLQIDAPVNPGNSGGPLFVKRGEDSYQWIGIVVSGIRDGQNLGFAIDASGVWDSAYVDSFTPGLEQDKFKTTYAWSGYPQPCPTPADAKILFEMRTPEQVRPNQTYKFYITITNRIGYKIDEMSIRSQLPRGFILDEVNNSPKHYEDILEWTLRDFNSGDSIVLEIKGKVPRPGAAMYYVTPRVKSSIPGTMPVEYLDSVSKGGIIYSWRAYPFTAKNPSEAKLLIERELPQFIMPNQEYPYEIKITNRSFYPIDDVVMTETLPAGFVLDNTSITPDKRGNALRWSLGMMAPGQSEVITIVGKGEKPGKGTHSGETIITYKTPKLVGMTKVLETTHQDQHPTVKVSPGVVDVKVSPIDLTYAWSGYPQPCPTPADAKILFEMFVPEQVRPNQTYKFYIKTTNRADYEVDQLVIEQQLPQNFILEQASDHPIRSDDVLTWTINNVKSGRSMELEVTGNVSRLGGAMYYVTPRVMRNSSRKELLPQLVAMTKVIEPVLQFRVSAVEEVFLDQVFPVEMVFRNVGSAPVIAAVLDHTLTDGLATEYGGRKVVMNLGDIQVNETVTRKVNLKGVKVGSYENNFVVKAKDGVGDSAALKTFVRRPRK